METRYFEWDDAPVSADGRFGWEVDNVADAGPRTARIWHGSSSRPFPWSELLFATEISRREFDDLRALAAELAA